MNTRTSVPLVALCLLGASAACTKSTPSEGGGPASAVAPELDGRREEAHGPSDLDRPVEELVAFACEHQKKAFECDACRYEVGFVRAPASLVEGGLVATVEVARRKVDIPIALTGEVRFDERRVGHVSSQVEGMIKKVHVALGDRVEAGQPLVEIESAVIGDAQAAYLDAQGMLRLARRNFERVSELRKDQIASEREFLQAKQEAEAAEIRAQAALGKLTRLGTDDTGRGRVVLRAPLAGTVLAMHAVAGEIAKTDESLLTVSDNKTVWVWADLYERDIAAVKNGQAKQRLTAAIAVKAYPGEEFPGTVELVSPAMDASSRTVKVRIEVGNEDGRLLAGMFAAVRLFLPGTDARLAIPRAALLEDEGRAFVFVHHDAEYYLRRPVVVGRVWPGWAEVEQGLAPGQTVVTEGAFLMKSDVLRSKMGAGCAD